MRHRCRHATRQQVWRQGEFSSLGIKRYSAMHRPSYLPIHSLFLRMSGLVWPCSVDVLTRKKVRAYPFKTRTFRSQMRQERLCKMPHYAPTILSP